MDLYYMPFSPPCRAVLMTVEALGIKVNKKFLDLFSGEQFTSKYLRLNPQHKIPTLVDGDFSLGESRAIMIYLAEQYGNNNPVYPNDPKKRAIINQRLFFDVATLYRSFLDVYAGHSFRRHTDPENNKNIENVFEYLNSILQGRNYVAGDVLTLADLSLLATVSSFEVVNHDFSRYANVTSWYERLKRSAPGWEENWAGCMEYKRMLGI